jgi:hypothetical protein
MTADRWLSPTLSVMQDYAQMMHIRGRVNQREGESEGG